MGFSVSEHVRVATFHLSSSNRAPPDILRSFAERVDTFNLETMCALIHESKETLASSNHATAVTQLCMPSHLSGFGLISLAETLHAAYFSSFGTIAHRFSRLPLSRADLGYDPRDSARI